MPKPELKALEAGDLVHSSRSGGTFRVVLVNRDRDVCKLEDFRGRVWPFDLDYVQSHFKPFGAVGESE